MKRSRPIVCLAWSIRDVQLYKSLLSDSEVIIVCARLSSWLYAKFSLVSCVAFFMPFWKYRKKKSWNNRNMDLISDYDLRFYNNTCISSVDLWAMETYLAEKLKGTPLKLLLLPGEFRLREQAMIRQLGNTNKTVFWEAGPPGSIYFSPYGTNANAKLELTYKGRGVPQMLEEKNTQCIAAINHKIRPWDKLFLGVDYIYLLILKLLSYLEFDELLPAKQKLKMPRNVHQHFNRSECEGKSLVIFYGQVEEDVNQSHFGITEIQLKGFLDETGLAGDKYQVLLKTHPRQQVNKTNTFLSETIQSLCFYSDQVSRTFEYFDKVYHVTINSNVALELLLQGNNVTILGRSIYSNLAGVSQSLNYKETCPEVIKNGAESFVKAMFLSIDYRNRKFLKLQRFSKFLEALTEKSND